MVAILANSLGSVCLSKGMKQSTAVAVTLDTSGLMLAGWQALSNAWIIAGILLLLVFLVAFLVALSWADLSFVLPATAPGYILTTILSHVVLQEVVSPLRWAGTVFIVLGTWLVAKTYCPVTPKLKPLDSEADRNREQAIVEPLATALEESSN
ncbi:MAG: hypothetical protein HY648_13435 [Acidobacteria bacterium]|nr:hypothetical protein [Acidobacteriota bacterium]